MSRLIVLDSLIRMDWKIKEPAADHLVFPVFGLGARNVESLVQTRGTRTAPPERPDCRDFNPESRRTPQRARFPDCCKGGRVNAAPLSVLLNWASDIDENKLVV
jgi:hypothetical protein